MNLMEGDVVDGGVELGDYVVPVSRDVLAKVPNETKLTLGIRPEAFTLASEGIGLDVAVVEELGADAYLYGSSSDPASRPPSRMARLTRLSPVFLRVVLRSVASRYVWA